jgi:hypothetical protein
LRKIGESERKRERDLEREKNVLIYLKGERE